MGYRYYFRVLPKGIYLGVRAHIWSMGMFRTADLSTDKTNVLIGQPNAEIGYTGVINDIAFFTVYYSVGKQFTISSPGDSFLYGKSSVSVIGVSGGIRF